jgi:hypothetical protein
MGGIGSTASVLFLALAGCWVGSDEWKTWEEEHGALDSAEGDADTDADTDAPPADQCSEPWGWVETPFGEDPWDEVDASEAIAVGLAHEALQVDGETDLCDVGCDPVSGASLTHYIPGAKSEADLPVRIEPGDGYWLMIDVQNVQQAGSCWLVTMAGDRTVEVAL